MIHRASCVSAMQDSRTWLFPTFHENAFGGLKTRSRTVARELLSLGDTVVGAYSLENTFADLQSAYPERCFCIPLNIRPEALSPAGIARASRLIASFGVDGLFLFHSAVPRFPAILLAAMLRGVKYRVVHHGTVPHPPPQGLGGRYFGGLVRGFHISQRIRRFGGRLGSRAVTHALFNNDDDLDRWTASYRYAAANCRLWLPPLDVARFFCFDDSKAEAKRRIGLSGKFVFGSVGRMSPAKGFGDLITAFELVQRKRTDCDLVIVGDGSEREALVGLADDAGISGKVHFVGFHKDVRPFLAAMDVFVSSSRRESLGLSILEAMSAGVPVIVTDLPGPRSVVQNGAAGVVVPVGDPTALAQAMSNLAETNVRRDELSRTGRQRATQCDARKVVAELLDWITR